MHKLSLTPEQRLKNIESRLFSLSDLHRDLFMEKLCLEERANFDIAPEDFIYTLRKGSALDLLTLITGDADFVDALSEVLCECESAEALLEEDEDVLVEDWEQEGLSLTNPEE